MATLTSANWTIAGRNGTPLSNTRRIDTMLTDSHRFVNLKLSIPTGNLTSTAKLTLPGFQSVGLVRRLDKYIIDNPVLIASGSAGAAVSGPLMVGYLVTGNQLTFSRVTKASGTNSAVARLSSGVSFAAQNFYVTAVGW